MGFVLGLSGAAGSGKDTVADYLISERGWTKKLSFAANLKEMCRRIFYLSHDQINLQEEKARMFATPKEFTQRNLASIMAWMSTTHPQASIPKESMTKVLSLIGTKLDNPRKILQFIGTEFCRTLIPTYHLDCLMQKIEKEPDGFFIITDARFPNEGDLIADKLGGMVARLERPSPEAAQNIDRAHPSETAMLEWGRFGDTINNNREGLPYLYEEVDSFLRRNDLCQETMVIQSSANAAESSSPMEGTAVLRNTGTTQITP